MQTHSYVDACQTCTIYTSTHICTDIYVHTWIDACTHAQIHTRTQERERDLYNAQAHQSWRVSLPLQSASATPCQCCPSRSHWARWWCVRSLPGGGSKLYWLQMNQSTAWSPKKTIPCHPPLSTPVSSSKQRSHKTGVTYQANQDSTKHFIMPPHYLNNQLCNSATCWYPDSSHHCTPTKHNMKAISQTTLTD